MNEVRTGGRVAVTGLGLVCPLGRDLDSSMDNLARGRRAPVCDCDGLPIACVPASFDPKSHFRMTKNLKLADRKTCFAVAAAAMARLDAGIPDDGGLSEAAVILGAGASDMRLGEISQALAPDPAGRSATDIPFFAERVMSGLNPLWLIITLPNMASSHVAIQLQACGPNNTIMTDCIAGTQAVGEGFGLVREGEAPLAVCGGTDTGTCALAIESCRQAGLFAAVPAGNPGPGAVPLGEGAGIVILEDMESALGRNAKVYAEVMSYSCRQAAPKAGADSLDNTMREALQRAGWATSEVDAICATGARNRLRGTAKRKLIDAGFPNVTSAVELESFMGDALAASGAMALVLLLALLHRRGSRVNVLLNSVGLSGQAATLCLSSRFQEKRHPLDARRSAKESY